MRLNQWWEIEESMAVNTGLAKETNTYFRKKCKEKISILISCGCEN